MTAAPTPSPRPVRLARWVAVAALLCTPFAPACRCQGGDPTDPDPVEDDTTPPEDDDTTRNDDAQHYDVSGFWLEIGEGSAGDYSGISVDQGGVLRLWSGAPGQHAEEAYRATLTQEQMYRIHTWLEDAGFFDLEADPGDGDVCAVTHRMGQQSHRVDHAADAVPAALSPFYADLADLLDPFGVSPGCG